MSKEYEGQDPMALARQAERDLNSHEAKHGSSGSDSSAPPTFPAIHFNSLNSLQQMTPVSIPAPPTNSQEPQ